jgi:hypothetical protein
LGIGHLLGHARDNLLRLGVYSDCAEIDGSAQNSAKTRAVVDLDALSVAAAIMPAMQEVFVGSEAVAHGRVTKSELRRCHRAIFRNVYVAGDREPTLRDRTVGAWLWSRRRAVIAGIAASALHGAQWIDAEVRIELIAPSGRPQGGLVVRDEALADDEITRVSRLPVTTVARTAYDLGRHLPRGESVARLDALMRVTPFSVEDVLLLAKRYPGARGLRQLRAALSLVDGGAASPKETWLRLLLIDAGLPAPTTQIPVLHGYRPVAFLDMGWEQFKVAAEYDGDQHRTDRRQYVKDIRRHELVNDCGWNVVRVVSEDRPHDVIDRVYTALVRRGYRRDRR